ncbi:MAG TPA: hypothetical protein DCS93_14525 [Microscillaceae bacterium]|nr:hypothetical protein [Microscillaceae bacterium]
MVITFFTANETTMSGKIEQPQEKSEEQSQTSSQKRSKRKQPPQKKHRYSLNRENNASPGHSPDGEGNVATNRYIQSKQGKLATIQSKQGKRPIIQSKQGKLPPIQSKQGKRSTIQSKGQSKKLGKGTWQLIKSKSQDLPQPSRNANVSASPLPQPHQQIMETLTGVAMSAVRVYRNSPFPASVGAIATARSPEVHFAPGHYNDYHLFHELAHIAEQSTAQVPAKLQVGEQAINDDSAREQAADLLAAQALKNLRGWTNDKQTAKNQLKYQTRKSSTLQRVKLGIATFNLNHLTFNEDLEKGKAQKGSRKKGSGKKSSRKKQENDQKKVQLITEAFFHNPWLQMIAIQEYNEMNDPAELAKKVNKQLEGWESEARVQFISGPKMTAGGYKEYYPLLIRRNAGYTYEETKAITTAGKEIVYGQGEKQEDEEEITHIVHKNKKHEFDKKAQNFRPVVVHRVKGTKSEEKDYYINIAIVHTSPEGEVLLRKSEFTQIEKTLEKANQEAGNKNSENKHWVILGDFYLPPEATFTHKKQDLAKTKRGKVPEAHTEFGDIFGDSPNATELYEKDSTRRRNEYFKKYRNLNLVSGLPGTNWAHTSQRIKNYDGIRIADFLVVSQSFSQTMSGVQPVPLEGNSKYLTQPGVNEIDDNYRTIETLSPISDHIMKLAMLGSENSNVEEDIKNIRKQTDKRIAPEQLKRENEFSQLLHPESKYIIHQPDDEGADDKGADDKWVYDIRTGDNLTTLDRWVFQNQNKFEQNGEKKYAHLRFFIEYVKAYHSIVRGGLLYDETKIAQLFGTKSWEEVALPAFKSENISQFVHQAKVQASKDVAELLTTNDINIQKSKDILPFLSEWGVSEKSYKYKERTAQGNYANVSPRTLLSAMLDVTAKEQNRFNFKTPTRKSLYLRSDLEPMLDLLYQKLGIEEKNFERQEVEAELKQSNAERDRDGYIILSSERLKNKVVKLLAHKIAEKPEIIKGTQLDKVEQTLVTPESGRNEEKRSFTLAEALKHSAKTGKSNAKRALNHTLTHEQEDDDIIGLTKQELAGITGKSKRFEDLMIKWIHRKLSDQSYANTEYSFLSNKLAQALTPTGKKSPSLSERRNQLRGDLNKYQSIRKTAHRGLHDLSSPHYVFRNEETGKKHVPNWTQEGIWYFLFKIQKGFHEYKGQRWQGVYKEKYGIKKNEDLMQYYRKTFKHKRYGQFFGKGKDFFIYGLNLFVKHKLEYIVHVDHENKPVKYLQNHLDNAHSKNEGTAINAQFETAKDKAAFLYALGNEHFRARHDGQGIIKEEKARQANKYRHQYKNASAKISLIAPELDSLNDWQKDINPFLKKAQAEDPQQRQEATQFLSDLVRLHNMLILHKEDADRERISKGLQDISGQKRTPVLSNDQVVKEFLQSNAKNWADSFNSLAKNLKLSKVGLSSIKTSDEVKDLRESLVLVYYEFEKISKNGFQMPKTQLSSLSDHLENETYETFDDTPEVSIEKNFEERQAERRLEADKLDLAKGLSQDKKLNKEDFWAEKIENYDPKFLLDNAIDILPPTIVTILMMRVQTDRRSIKGKEKMLEEQLATSGKKIGIERGDTQLCYLIATLNTLAHTRYYYRWLNDGYYTILQSNELKDDPKRHEKLQWFSGILKKIKRNEFVQMDELKKVHNWLRNDLKMIIPDSENEQFDPAEVLEKMTSMITNKEDTLNFREKKQEVFSTKLTDEEARNTPLSDLQQIKNDKTIPQGKGSEKMHIIHLPVWEGSKNKPVRLSNYLASFLKKHNYEDNLKYKDGNKKKKAIHTIAHSYITRHNLPSMLVFRRRLLNYSRTHGIQRIAPPLIHPESFKIGRETYSCTAKILHSGGSGGGHYTSISGDRYRDDDRVMDKSQAEGRGKISLLVYERQYDTNPQYDLKFDEQNLKGSIVAAEDETILLNPTSEDLIKSDLNLEQIKDYLRSTGKRIKLKNTYDGTVLSPRRPDQRYRLIECSKAMKHIRSIGVNNTYKHVSYRKPLLRAFQGDETVTFKIELGWSSKQNDLQVQAVDLKVTSDKQNRWGFDMDIEKGRNNSDDYHQEWLKHKLAIGQEQIRRLDGKIQDLEGKIDELRSLYSANRGTPEQPQYIQELEMEEDNLWEIYRKHKKEIATYEASLRKNQENHRKWSSDEYQEDNSHIEPKRIRAKCQECMKYIIQLNKKIDSLYKKNDAIYTQIQEIRQKISQQEMYIRNQIDELKRTSNDKQQEQQSIRKLNWVLKIELSKSARNDLEKRKKKRPHLKRKRQPDTRKRQPSKRKQHPTTKSENTRMAKRHKGSKAGRRQASKRKNTSRFDINNRARKRSKPDD